MQIPMVSSDLRRWAMQCIDQANNPRSSGEERERLMRMRESLLALADNQDWLNGKAENVPGGGRNILYIDLGRPRQV
jgi:hypothetical protein